MPKFLELADGDLVNVNYVVAVGVRHNKASSKYKTLEDLEPVDTWDVVVFVTPWNSWHSVSEGATSSQQAHWGQEKVKEFLES